MILLTLVNPCAPLDQFELSLDMQNHFEIVLFKPQIKLKSLFEAPSQFGITFSSRVRSLWFQFPPGQRSLFPAFKSLFKPFSGHVKSLFPDPGFFNRFFKSLWNQIEINK